MINGGIQDGVPTVSEGFQKAFQAGVDRDLDLLVKKITLATEDELFQACVCVLISAENAPPVSVSVRTG